MGWTDSGCGGAARPGWAGRGRIEPGDGAQQVRAGRGAIEVSGPAHGPNGPESLGLQSPERRRLYEQLIQQLLSFVELRGLVIGDRLPSERDLALALHVSRASVRQATVALEVQGVLEVRHGDGIYLRARPDDPTRLVELMARRHRLPAVLEAREALETQLAALAAMRRS